MKTLEVTISPEGEVKIEAMGFTGSACSLATKAIERALGVVTSDKKLPEYYQKEGTKQTLNAS